MHLTRFARAADFIECAGAFLLRHEAHHNLILGLCTMLQRYPERNEPTPYLAVVVDGGQVVAAAIRTPPHNAVLSIVTANAPVEALRLLARDLHAHYSTLPGVLAPRAVSQSFAAIWHERSGQSYQLSVAQRIYQLTAVNDVPPAPGTLRHATLADRALVLSWLEEFNAETFGGPDPALAERTANTRLTGDAAALYFWDDGEPVSLAGYTGPTPNGVRVGPVYTPPRYRGRGYASNCVAAVSRLVLASGRRYCFLFTDLSNPTANHIYQQIGYAPVCDVDEYHFVTEP